LIAVAVLMMVRPLGAQRPAFEVASVKVNHSDRPDGNTSVTPNGAVLTNWTLRMLIQNAYHVLPFLIVEAPSWIDAERFDITAKSPAGLDATRFEAGVTWDMLQSLLEDRFRLRTHRETRELPAYELVTARSDGTLGPKLIRSTQPCSPPGTPTAPGTVPCRGVVGFSQAGGMMSATSFPLARVAGTLGLVVERPVVDHTGLDGTFEIDLQWSSAAASASSDTPGIFTALQEQLGLKLPPTTAPVEVLVVDAIERPNED
jgi:uncharacterized protein (TIGR03435 family)